MHNFNVEFTTAKSKTSKQKQKNIFKKLVFPSLSSIAISLIITCLLLSSLSCSSKSPDTNPKGEVLSVDVYRPNIDVIRQKAEKELFETMLGKIDDAANMCDLDTINKEDFHKFAQGYHDSEYILILKSRIDEKREELMREDTERFEISKQEMDEKEHIENIRTIVSRFRERYPCSNYLEELEKYAGLRIETINKMTSGTDIGCEEVVTGKKVGDSDKIPATMGGKDTYYVDDIRNVVININEAIRSGNVDKICQFLTEEDSNFYSREQKIVEDFISEIQVINSNIDDIRVTIDEDTASVQYVWDMKFIWKSYPSNELKSECKVFLKLKKNGDKWEIFDTGKMVSYNP